MSAFPPTAARKRTLSDFREGRFCCESQLGQAQRRDSVVLTRIAARSIHDGPSEE